MDYHVILGGIGSAVAIGTMVPYFWSVYYGRTRPHVFSWFLWGLFNGMAGVAQLMDGGGPGAWTNLVGAVLCWIGVVLGYMKAGMTDIKKSDWYALSGALIAIVPWALTKDPLLSVIMITFIDMIAFYPSFRKGWEKPHDDMVAAYVASDVKHILGLAALTNFSVTTVLFPASLILTNSLYVVMLLYRRKMVTA